MPKRRDLEDLTTHELTEDLATTNQSLVEILTRLAKDNHKLLKTQKKQLEISTEILHNLEIIRLELVDKDKDKH